MCCVNCNLRYALFAICIALVMAHFILGAYPNEFSQGWGVGFCSFFSDLRGVSKRTDNYSAKHTVIAGKVNNSIQNDSESQPLVDKKHVSDEFILPVNSVSSKTGN